MTWQGEVETSVDWQEETETQVNWQAEDETIDVVSIPGVVFVDEFKDNWQEGV